VEGVLDELLLQRDGYSNVLNKDMTRFGEDILAALLPEAAMPAGQDGDQAGATATPKPPPCTGTPSPGRPGWTRIAPAEAAVPATTGEAPPGPRVVQGWSKVPAEQANRQPAEGLELATETA
jgi:hypothetical protein